MDFDQIYERIGACGRQQKVYCLIILLGQVVCALHHVFLVFAGDIPSFQCLAVEKGTEVVAGNKTTLMAKACSDRNSGQCPQLVFDTSWKTVAMEMQLVCGEEYKVSVSQSAYMFGVLVGSIIFGVIADNIGRLKSLYLASILVLIGCFLLGISSSFHIFVYLRFFIGFGIAGFGLASYVLGTELLGGEYRGTYVALMSVFFAFGICALSGIALIVSDWRQLSHSIALITLINCLLFLKLPESPCWLVSKGRISEAKMVISSIAKGNGQKFPPESFDIKSHSPERVSETNSEGLFSILRHWELTKWTIIQIFSWFANSAVYYGLTMASGGLSDNLYVSVVLSGLAELPAYLMLYFAQQRVGRITLVCGNMILGGCSCALIMFLNADQTTARTVLALLGKMGISASFASIYLHSMELFPTTIRNAALGLCSMSARVGGVIAPFISMVGRTYPSKEFVIFGALGLFSGVLNLQLPETAGKSLPESISDVVHLSSPKKRKGKPQRSSSSASLLTNSLSSSQEDIFMA